MSIGVLKKPQHFLVVGGSPVVSVSVLVVTVAGSSHDFCLHLLEYPVDQLYG